jgi:hypothetical protein
LRGKCIHKKPKKSTKSAFGRKSTKKTTKKSMDKQRSVNILAAKKLLRTNYSVSVNGKMKAPSFITTLRGVNGKSGAEKVANLRRVLSTCKKVGVPLIKKNTRTFKSYRTLVTQCKIKFSSAMDSSVLNQKRGLEANQKASARLESKLKEFRKKLALRRVAKVSPKKELLLLDNSTPDEFYDSAPNFDYSQEYEEALRTPLPDDSMDSELMQKLAIRRKIPGNEFGYFNFGKKTTKRYKRSYLEHERMREMEMQKALRRSRRSKVPGSNSMVVNKPSKDYSQEYEEALRTPLPEFGRRIRRRMPRNMFGYYW